MTQPGILLDLTNFLLNPIRTGIQRIIYEVIRQWPGPMLVPVCLTPDGKLYRLPQATLGLIDALFQAKPAAMKGVGNQLRALYQPAQANSPVNPGDFAAFIIIELFWDEGRTSFLAQMLDSPQGERTFFMVHDLLPFLYPQWFNWLDGRGAMRHYRMLKRTKHLSFISSQTRTHYLDRLIRDGREPGPVVPLGADGLGTAPPRFDPRRKCFTVVSTLEPRKNHQLVLNAFHRLWAKGVDVELTFVGMEVMLSQATKDHVAQTQLLEPRFRWLNSLDDDGVRAAVMASRATIYVSQAEGFGLPPVESLALGVPVIVKADTPSILDLPPLGQTRLATVTVDSMCDAVLQLLDDSHASQKYEEIRELELPRWRDLAAHVYGWIARELHKQAQPAPTIALSPQEPSAEAWVQKGGAAAATPVAGRGSLFSAAAGIQKRSKD